MKKKKIILLGCILLVICLVTIVTSHVFMSKDVDSAQDTLKSKGLSMMLETGRNTGKYELVTRTSWPTEGYVFNETLSKCENGGTLEWDDVNKTVKVHTSVSDKCYVYFDVELPDVYIAVNNLPTTSTERKIGTVSCSSGGATYNQLYNRVEISSLTSDYESCNLTYANIDSKTYLNDYIISLTGTTQGTGQVVNENGYRYEGKNPNNYVWFNNELWRIIGVFDSNSHGQSGKNLVKLIRKDSIGSLVWNKYNSNNWSTSTLNNLLNGAYYNAENGTGGDYCYGYLYTVPTNCDYRVKGIQDGYRSMIQNVTWYLGGYSSASATAASFYGYERGTTVYSGRPTSSTGYIALMYPSDYGYAVLSSDCSRSTKLDAYTSSSCENKSWLGGLSDSFTITPDSSIATKVFNTYLNKLYSYYSGYVFSVMPVLYLKSDVYLVDGNGTLSSPYIIGF